MTTATASSSSTGDSPGGVSPAEKPQRPLLFRHKLLPLIVGLALGWVVCWFVDQGTDPLTTLRALRAQGEDCLTDAYRDRGWAAAVRHGDLRSAGRISLRSSLERAIRDGSRLRVRWYLFLGAEPTGALPCRVTRIGLTVSLMMPCRGGRWKWFAT